MVNRTVNVPLMHQLNNRRTIRALYVLHHINAPGVYSSTSFHSRFEWANSDTILCHWKGQYVGREPNGAHSTAAIFSLVQKSHVISRDNIMYLLISFPNHARRST